jgi:tetratricopeptide (TPR) repeat protein
MLRALHLKILSCLMIIIFPAAMFAADQASAMLYSHGTALLNGTNVPRKGMYPTALAEFDKIANQDKAVAPENQLVAGIVGWTYAVSGRRLDALQMAKQFKDLSSHTYVDLYFPAAIYAGLNNKDEAFRLLEKAYEQHLAGILYLGIDPFFDGMRSDPRFPDLLRRMGLPQPQ